MTQVHTTEMTMTLPSDREVRFTRFFAAPRARVFKAWTQPEHVAQWWGCSQSTMIVCDADVRPGGRYRYVMKGPDGAEHPFHGVYRAVAPPERFEHTQVYDVAPFSEDEATVTVTLEPVDGGTVATETVLLPSAATRDGYLGGGCEAAVVESFNRLAAHLDVMGRAEEASPRFEISRTFAAPRERVWDAFTREDCLRQWWAPRGFENLYSKVDLRPEGTFQYRLRGPEGLEVGGLFRYQEVAPPERMRYIVAFVDEAGAVTRHPMIPDWPLEIVCTTALTERDGQTLVSIEWVPHNPTDAERKVFADNEESMHLGWTGTLDNLDAFLTRG